MPRRDGWKPGAKQTSSMVDTAYCFVILRTSTVTPMKWIKLRTKHSIRLIRILTLAGLGVIITPIAQNTD
jgi:hypothetical protein